MHKLCVNSLRLTTSKLAYFSAFHNQRTAARTNLFALLKLVPATAMSSLARQRFSQECEDAINRQINMELYASYVYLSMAYHFDRDDVALPGMHWYFKKASDEEREHAMKLMKYLNKRGGRIVLEDIKRPEEREWNTAEDAMCMALEMEKKVNESLLDIHAVASDLKDANFCDFLESEFLKEQVEAIKEISDHVTKLKRVGDGVGTFLYDRAIKDSEIH